MTRPRTVRVTPQMLRDIAELGEIARAFARNAEAGDYRAAAGDAQAFAARLKRLEEEPK